MEIRFLTNLIVTKPSGFSSKSYILTQDIKEPVFRNGGTIAFLF
ncbi:hypothetical protein LEP1GSC024_3372 [Leptospira noguchii str. 2001034031]|uniref:Uncharacterized protein n=1 Tax=Leptospira noguchii str. 2001034031 TaxID=1193053 RepID=M6Y1L6_9LEPT|nr:hypothetical protein LEP1GSC024_3372 [Leptospira noguchii str. 2001034031]